MTHTNRGGGHKKIVNAADEKGAIITFPNTKGMETHWPQSISSGTRGRTRELPRSAGLPSNRVSSLLVNRFYSAACEGGEDDLSWPSIMPSPELTLGTRLAVKV